MSAGVNVARLVRVRCHFCSRQKLEFDVHHLGSVDRPAQVICAECLDWHNRALEFLAGRAMPGCQSCLATWEFLRESRVGVENIRMYVVPKDGILQVLCEDCIRPYVEKRADLYRGTPFGTKTLNL
jgi:hypothetical protein